MRWRTDILAVDEQRGGSAHLRMDSVIENTPQSCPDLCSISVVPQVLEVSIILFVVIVTAVVLLYMFWRKSGFLRGVR